MASNFRINNGNYLRFGLQSMRKVNPCCGISLEAGARFIAIAQMAISGLIICFASLLFVLVVAVHEAAKNAKETDETTIDQWKHKLGAHLLLSILVGIVLLSCLGFYLHYYLYKGIKEKSYKKVNLWWNIELALLLIFLVQNIAMSIRNSEGTMGFIEISNLIFDMYSLWVIFEYKTELSRTVDPTVEFERVL